MKVLMNHIYEYKKGVRRMVLFTFNKKYEDFAIRRLESQNIKYVIQPVGNDRLNLYFGREECLNAIRMIVTRPLNLLTPEEDFMLGAMLGYDICAQCERYCERKDKCNCHLNSYIPFTDITYRRVCKTLSSTPRRGRST